ncbi:hypothetical protein SK128_001211, partial [Halocaridina rubra]
MFKKIYTAAWFLITCLHITESIVRLYMNRSRMVTTTTLAPDTTLFHESTLIHDHSSNHNFYTRNSSVETAYSTATALSESSTLPTLNWGERYDFDTYRYEEFPPCNYNAEGKLILGDSGLCNSGNTTVYVTCYRDDNTFSICLRDKPKYSFANNKQFLHYIVSSLVKSYDRYALNQACNLGLFINYGPVNFRGLFRLGADGKFLMTDNEYVISQCLPIYKTFSECIEIEGNSVCWDEDIKVIFLRPACTLPVLQSYAFEFLMYYAILYNNSETIDNICDSSNTLGIFEEIVDGIPITFFPNKFKYYLYSNYTRINHYWPCCYTYYTLVWNQDPKAAGLSLDWSYLSHKCQAGEIIFIVFQGLLAVFGIAGNLMVLSVMFSGGHRNEASSFLRTSLSVADFLASVFVVIPAICDSMNIIQGVPNVVTMEIEQSTNISVFFEHLPISPYDLHHLTLFRENGEQYGAYFFNIEDHYKEFCIKHGASETYFPLFNYSNGWFKVFRAQFLCLCSCTTIIIMFFLSIERLILCWRPLKYKQLFTLERVKVAIFFSWGMGALSLVVISHGNYTAVFWHTFTKLTHGFRDTSQIYNKPLLVISIMLGIMGTSTVILSVLALIAFCVEQAKVAQERKDLKMRVTDDFEKENLYITISLILITVLYVTVYVPVGVAVLVDHNQFKKEKYPFLHFLAWWLLLSGSASNPFLYNLRSSQFKSDMAESIQRLLPESLKPKMKPYITRSRHKFNNFLKDMEKADEKGLPFDGLPEGSKLAAIGLGFRTDPQ